MGLFQFPRKKRAAARGFQPQPKQAEAEQTFILEPMLTPSGLIDSPDTAHDFHALELSHPTTEIEANTLPTIDHAVPSLETMHSDPAIADSAITPVAFVFEPDPTGVHPIDPNQPLFSTVGTDLAPISMTSGIFTVGPSGQVSVDYLFDGGSYQGEVAIFSLQGMEHLEPGSTAFIQEAARRALSETHLGHVVIQDATEGAKFSAKLPWEGNFNKGKYLGEHTVEMEANSQFAVMLVPKGTVQDLFKNPDSQGAIRPLFSLVTANPINGLQFNQIGDVTGDGHTFAFEDQRIDAKSDLDYNDLVFHVRGATGYASPLDNLINPQRDWRTTETGQDLIDYANVQNATDAVSTTPTVSTPITNPPDATSGAGSPIDGNIVSESPTTSASNPISQDTTPIRPDPAISTPLPQDSYPVNEVPQPLDTQTETVQPPVNTQPNQITPGQPTVTETAQSTSVDQSTPTQPAIAEPIFQTEEMTPQPTAIDNVAPSPTATQTNTVASEQLPIVTNSAELPAIESSANNRDASSLDPEFTPATLTAVEDSAPSSQVSAMSAASFTSFAALPQREPIVQTGVLWRSATTGANLIWTVNGLTLVDQTSIPSPVVSDPNWEMRGSGDFNRDGNPDILWRNARTGENAVWLMNGTQFQSGYLIQPVSDTTWNIVGSGDFNRDGNPDILWRNNTTGQITFWFMDAAGQNIQSSANLSQNAGTVWQVQGVGDFNKDGSPDLLWRNPQTGENAVWLMNGSQLGQGIYINSALDLNWQIQGAADFNRDGGADIFWRNVITGENAVWLMAGTTFQGVAYLPSLPANQQWKATLPFPITEYAPSITAWLQNDTGRNAADQITTDPTIVGQINADRPVSKLSARLSGSSQWIDMTARLQSDNRFVLTSQQLQQLNRGNALLDGSYTVQIQAKDNHDNLSSVSTVTFILDRQSPASPQSLQLLTPNTQPTLIGNAEPNSTILVSDNNQVIGQTTTKTDGSWQLALQAPLSITTHRFTATAIDTAGNTSSLSSVLSFTPVPPPAPPTQLKVSAQTDTGVSNSDAVTKNATPMITGTAEPNAIVKLYRDTATVIGQAQADATGAWQIQTTVLTSGVQTLTATATNSTGEGQASTPLIVTIDTQVPDTPQAVQLAMPYTTPTLTGTAEPGSTVVVLDNNQVIGQATTKQDGTWQLALASPLSFITHRFTATSTDVAGNTSAASPELSFTPIPKPNTPSQLKLTLASDTGVSNADGVTKVATPIVTGVTSPNAIVTLYNQGQPIGQGQANSTGAWQITTAALQDGLQALTAIAANEAGTSSASSLNITIDTKAPTAPQNFQLSNPYTSPTLSGTAEPNTTVVVSDNNQVIGQATSNSDGSWQLTLSNPLSQTTHNFTAISTDTAGNTSTRTTPISFTPVPKPDTPRQLQLSPNSDTGISNTDLITKSTTPTIIGVTSPNAIVSLRSQGNLIAQGQADATGAWQITTPPLDNGIQIITASASNDAGTSPGIPLYFRIDTFAPFAPQINQILTPYTTPTLTGYAEGNSIVTIFDNNQPIGQTSTPNENGAWQLVLPAPLSLTTHNFTATATDTAGNISALASALTFTPISKPDAPTQLKLSVDTDTGFSNTDGVTKIATPSVTGITSPNAIVSLFNAQGQPIGQGQANGSGAWQITTTALTDFQSITAIAANEAGTSATSTPLSITIDTQVPIVPQNLQLSTPYTTPTLTGSAEPNSIVIVSDNNQVIGETITKQDGTWQISLLGPLTAETHSFTATSTDSAGNISAASTELSFTPVALPITPTQLKLSTVSDTGASNSDGVTRIVNPTVTGTTSPNAIVTLYNNGQPIGQGQADQMGAWQVTPTTLSAGIQSITAISSNEAGTSAVSTPLSITIDTQPPSAPQLAQIVTPDTTPILTGQAEPKTQVVVSNNNQIVGQVIASQDGTWQINLPTPLTEGTYTFTATSTDSAGNVSVPSSSLSFTPISLPAPPTQLKLSTRSDTGISNKDGITGDKFPIVTGKAAPNAIVKLYNGSTLVAQQQADSTGAWEIQSDSLTDGTYSLTATATDARGESPASASLNITIDTQAPTSPYDIQLLNTTVAPILTGKAEPNTVISVSQGQTSWKTQTGTNGTWQLVLPTTLPIATQYDFTVTAADAGGNASNSTTLTVEFLPPDPPTQLQLMSQSDTGISNVDRITQTTTPTITGLATPSAIVKLYTETALVGQGRADNFGVWTITTDRLEEGTQFLAATTTTFFGGESALSMPLSITIDVQPPNKPSAQLLENISPLTLAGDADPGTTIRITDQYGLEVAAYSLTTVDETGAWRTAVTSPPYGSHRWQVVAVDAAGNISQPMVVEKLQAPQSLALLADSDSGTSSSDRITNITTPTVSGTAYPGTTVQLLRNGASVGQTIVGENGSWEITTTALGEGTHTLVAIASSDLSQSPASTPLHITIDTTPPITQLTDPPDGVAWFPEQPFTGTVSDSSEQTVSVSYLIDGQPIGEFSIPSNTSFDQDLSSLLSSFEPGSLHTLLVKATDLAGNAQTLPSLTFMAPNELEVTDDDPPGWEPPDPSDPTNPSNPSNNNGGGSGGGGTNAGNWLSSFGPGPVLRVGLPTGDREVSPGTPPPDLPDPELTGDGYHFTYIEMQLDDGHEDEPHLGKIAAFIDDGIDNLDNYTRKGYALEQYQTILNHIAKQVYEGQFFAGMEQVMYDLYVNPNDIYSDNDDIGDNGLSVNASADRQSMKLRVYQAEVVAAVNEVLKQQIGTDLSGDPDQVTQELLQLAFIYAGLNPKPAPDQNSTIARKEDFLDALWQAKGGNTGRYDEGVAALAHLLDGVEQPTKALKLVNNLLKTALNVTALNGKDGPIRQAQFLRELVAFAIDYVKANPTALEEPNTQPSEFFLDTLIREGDSQNALDQMSQFFGSSNGKADPLKLVQYERRIIQAVEGSNKLKAMANSNLLFFGNLLNLGSAYAQIDPSLPALEEISQSFLNDAWQTISSGDLAVSFERFIQPLSLSVASEAIEFATKVLKAVKFVLPAQPFVQDPTFLKRYLYLARDYVRLSPTANTTEDAYRHWKLLYKANNTQSTIDAAQVLQQETSQLLSSSSIGSSNSDTLLGQPFIATSDESQELKRILTSGVSRYAIPDYEVYNIFPYDGNPSQEIVAVDANDGDNYGKLVGNRPFSIEEVTNYSSLSHLYVFRNGELYYYIAGTPLVPQPGDQILVERAFPPKPDQGTGLSSEDQAQIKSGLEEIAKFFAPLGRFVAGAIYQWAYDIGESGRIILNLMPDWQKLDQSVEQDLPKDPAFVAGRLFGDGAAAVTGLLGIISGGSAVVVGTPLCLTGIGCLAGAPAIATGSALAIAGTITLTEALENAISNASVLLSSGLNIPFSKDSPDTSSSRSSTPTQDSITELADRESIQQDEAFAILELINRRSIKKDGLVIVKEVNLGKFFGFKESNLPKLPEALIEKQNGTFIAVEVKNQVTPDIDGTLSKFRQTAELMKGKNKQISEYHLYLNRNKFEGQLRGTYSVGRGNFLFSDGKLVQIGNKPIQIRFTDFVGR